MLRFLAVLPLLFAAVPAAATVVEVGSTAPDGSTTVFVRDVVQAGGDPALAEQVTRLLADAVHALGDLRVLSEADVAAVMDLEASKKLLGCEDDASCLARLAEGVNADLLVSGTVGQVGSELMLSLSLIETASAAVRQRVSAALGEPAEHGARIKSLVEQLFGRASQEGPRFRLPEGEALSFAVLDLTAAGVSEDVATNLTQVLSAEIKRIDGATVVGKADIAAMLELEADKAAFGCSDDTACLAEVGGALGVERIVVGHVGKIADSYVVSLRLIATREALVENRVSETFRGLESQTLNAVRYAGRKLLGIEEDARATLALSSPHEGAVVWLDGAEVGAFPLPPIGELAPGRHELRVSFKDHLDLRTDVYLGPGETVSLWAELERAPAEWYESWAVWTAAAGAAAATIALVAGGVFVGYQLWDQSRTYPLEVKASLPARGAP